MRIRGELPLNLDALTGIGHMRGTTEEIMDALRQEDLGLGLPHNYEHILQALPRFFDEREKSVAIAMS